MSLYRNRLPQLADNVFLTDGGCETTYIFHEGKELPYFALFDLLKSEEGRAWLQSYYARYMAIAKSNGTGFILESPTWRANPDWAAKLGYSQAALDAANAQAIDVMRTLRDHAMAKDGGKAQPIVISGCLGPRGDGYDPGQIMTATEAEEYHSAQIRVFAASQADMVSAMTMTNAEEAIGIARAAASAGIPSAISFTLETDGKLPTGQSLRDAIETVDDETDGSPAYFCINCAHPTHFTTMLANDGDWLLRLRGIRANASKRSHAELDEATDLDDGDPVQLGREYLAIRRHAPWINVLGGCCGTDHRHVEQIGHCCASAAG
ncbi:homocysteine S-methyltransferase family protein [Dongia soli]|uniref:Homocysteine S-methyltransferase family protein n=1 Tax=Dongia soli TaxID=600628 RepID=A0ABU5EGF1_9PROT|nr:homocysteine S-methyltransferase family protein [Dongia soli]MDY0884570.1 homocysteine S-methyltransferase family protein [Dongia soli]